MYALVERPYGLKQRVELGGNVSNSACDQLARDEFDLMGVGNCLRIVAQSILILIHDMPMMDDILLEGIGDAVCRTLMITHR